MRIEQKLSIPLFLIATGNLVDCISKSSPFIDYIFYCLLFYSVGILFLFLRIKNEYKIISGALLVISLVTVWFGEYTDLISITLFCFSIYISGKNIRTYYLYSALLIIAILIKLTLDDINFSQSVVFLSGASFLFVLYHHYIHPSSTTNQSYISQKDYKIDKVNSDVVDIVQLRIEGYDWPKINDTLELNVRDSEIPRKVRKERNRLNFGTQDQFVFWLLEECIITSKKTESALAAERRDNL